MRYFWVLGLVYALGVASALPLRADPIWTNPITGTQPSLDNPYITGDSKDANISVSGIGAGSGLTANIGADRYNFRSWTTAGVKDVNDFFSWTLTPNAGYQIDFTSLTGSYQGSTDTPLNYGLEYSINGGATFLPLESGPLASGTHAFNFSLSSATFDSVTTPISFRLYGWGAASAGGTLSINDFAFNGVVSAVGVPTPAASAGGALLLGGLAAWRWGTRSRFRSARAL
jgi:hypothetical protein